MNTRKILNGRIHEVGTCGQYKIANRCPHDICWFSLYEILQVNNRYKCQISLHIIMKLTWEKKKNSMETDLQFFLHWKHTYSVLKPEWSSYKKPLTIITPINSCLRENRKPCLRTLLLMALAISPTLWMRLSFIVRSYDVPINIKHIERDENTLKLVAMKQCIYQSNSAGKSRPGIRKVFPGRSCNQHVHYNWHVWLWLLVL